MAHETPLITAIVMGLCIAFLFGAIANRLKVSPLVGYLLAGVLAGPNTPGFHADPGLTNQLAEIGIILLMFGVGLHFSLKDLLSVRAIAVPGAVVQMAVATVLGMCLGLVLGWGIGGSLVFGLALSTASTVVLLRAMQEKHLLETSRGRIAIGWLVVEDFAMVLALVLLPALANVGRGEAVIMYDPVAEWLELGVFGLISLTVIKVIIFVAIMLIIGRRIIPWLLKIISQTGSRELFSLSVLAVALGVAFGAAHLFGVSLALGAFFAGMIMNESDLSHRAAEETLPLRDAFAVLFFVSVGMLFEPVKLISDFIPLFATLLIIIVGKSLAAFLIVRFFNYPLGTALTISASLAQIGEFSFILASFGNNLGILGNDARDLILGSAILSILLNPLIFAAADKVRKKSAFTEEIEEKRVPSSKNGHVILIGYGRVGQRVADILDREGIPFIVIEEIVRNAEKARALGFETINGNAVFEKILYFANISRAYNLILTGQSSFEAGKIITLAKNRNSSLRIVAHVLSEAENQYLLDLGASSVVSDDQEIAKGILSCIFQKDDSLYGRVVKEKKEKTDNNNAYSAELSDSIQEESREKALLL